MGLLHDYQDGTSYRRDAPPRGERWPAGAPPYKSYTEAGAETVKLAHPAQLRPADLWQVLRDRRSRRAFAREPLAQEDLFLLLWAAQGVTQPGPWPLRTAPSAGALYPVETYVLAARVADLGAGVYHWELPEERLARVTAREDVAGAARAACLGQEMVEAAAATVVWTALWARGGQKYGERALRYAYLDAGHAAENLHLAAEALGLACCMIGAFFDDAMNQLVGVDGQAESVLYAAAVGRLQP